MATKAEWKQLAALCDISCCDDPVLNERIAVAAYGWSKTAVMLEPYGESSMLIDTDGNGPQIAKDYVSSTDAVFDMIKEVLPHTTVMLGQHLVHRYWMAAIHELDPDGVPYDIGSGSHSTVRARALAAAFCRAMADQIKEERT